MKILILSLIAASSFASTTNLTVAKVKQSKAREFISNFNFNYFVSYTGPSLSGDYKANETFNRFDGGRDSNDKELDNNGSTQMYQSFKLGYTFKNKMNLSYGVTMQENLKSDVEYTQTNSFKNTRPNGESYNGHRMSLFIPSVLNLSFGWVSTSIFYQTPIASERRNGTKHGYGIQPGLNFYSKVKGLSYGIGSTFERIVGTNETSTNFQGVKVSITPSVNYRLTERFTLKNSFDFDWDQKGDQIGTTEFGRNMHDVGRVGIGSKISNNIKLDTYLTYSVSDIKSENTSLGASLDISI